MSLDKKHDSISTVNVTLSIVTERYQPVWYAHNEQRQCDLRRSERECVPRSSVHARSLFKDLQVTPIGPMLRTSDSIFIVYTVLKFFKFDNGEIFFISGNQKLLKIRRTFYNFINVFHFLYFIKDFLCITVLYLILYLYSFIETMKT